MKKYIPVILLAATIAFAGCQKDRVIPQDRASESYWPVTSGNSWTYRDQTGMGISSFTVKMTGSTESINDRKYYASASLKNGVNTISYIYEGGHVYILRDTLEAIGTSVELQMCDDSQPAGYTWTMQPTIDGTIEGVPAQTINQIISKNDTMTVNGKNYANVIHTKVQLQYDTGNGFQTVAIYDFYLAKGIGMIETDTSSGGYAIESETLTNYSVK